MNKKLPEIKFEIVRQEDKCGCGVACVATITGQSYAATKKDFKADLENIGVPTQKLCNYLADKGYSVLRNQVSHYFDKDFAREFLTTPFAPTHMVEMRAKCDTITHLVVMGADGKFYCPDRLTDAEVRECYQIVECVGVYPPAERNDSTTNKN